MYIRGLIPRNFAELAEAVPIAVQVELGSALLQQAHGLKQRRINVDVTLWRGRLNSAFSDLNNVVSTSPRLWYVVLASRGCSIRCNMKYGEYSSWTCFTRCKLVCWEEHIAWDESLEVDG